MGSLMKHNLMLEDDERDRFDSAFSDPLLPRDLSTSLAWYAAPAPESSASGGLVVLPASAEPDRAPSDAGLVFLSPAAGTEDGPPNLIELIGNGRPIDYIVTTGNSTTTVYEDGTSETVVHLLGPSGPPAPVGDGAEDIAASGAASGETPAGTGDGYIPVLTGPDPIEDIPAQPVESAVSAKGTSGDDLIHGTGDGDLIRGLAGNDTIHGMGGADVIRGGAGNDKLYGADGDDEMFGGAGNDSLHGGRGDDILKGGAGDDWVKGYDGDDVVRGGAGNDTLIGGAGNDEMHGGSGSDTALYFGHSSEYSLRWDGDVLVVSHDIDTFAGPTDGVDRLSGVEFVQFADKTISVADLETSPGLDTEAEAIIEFEEGDNGLLDFSNENRIVDGATTGNTSWVEYEDGTVKYSVHLLGPPGSPGAPLTLNDVIDPSDILGDAAFGSGGQARDASGPSDLAQGDPAQGDPAGHRFELLAAPVVTLDDMETIIPDALI